MEQGYKRAQATCRSCKRPFPLVAATRPEELQQARKLLERGRGFMRVPRWCSWCHTTNVFELPLAQMIVTGEELLFRDESAQFKGLPPRPHEVIED